jgi:hypothetical protein
VKLIVSLFLCLINLFQGCNDEIHFESSNASDETLSWGEASSRSCESHYQAGFIASDESLKFTIGLETCENETHCNAPLKPGTRYAVTLRVFHGESFTDLSGIEFETENESNLMGILLIAAGFVILAVAAICFVKLCKSRSENSLSQKPKSTSIDSMDENDYDEISLETGSWSDK